MEQWYKLYLQKTHTVLALSHFEFLREALFTFRIFWRLALVHSCTAESISSFSINIGNLTPNSTVSWLKTPEFENECLSSVPASHFSHSSVFHST